MEVLCVCVFCSGNSPVLLHWSTLPVVMFTSPLRHRGKRYSWLPALRMKWHCFYTESKPVARPQAAPCYRLLFTNFVIQVGAEFLNKLQITWASCSSCPCRLHRQLSFHVFATRSAVQIQLRCCLSYIHFETDCRCVTDPPRVDTDNVMCTYVLNTRASFSFQPNVAVWWALPFRIREVSCSILSLGNVLSWMRFFVVFFRPSMQLSTRYLILGHDRFLPYPFHFIIRILRIGLQTKENVSEFKCLCMIITKVCSGLN
jgi:hypothetical protein